MTDRCKRCGERLPRLAMAHEDPYCSVECAMRAHGVTVRDGDQFNRRETRLMPRESSDRWRRIRAYPVQVDRDELDGPSL